MNNWLQAMKQWSQWLLGEAPLPDGRSKAMLAGTVAAAAVIAVGVPAAIPSSPSATAAPQSTPSAAADASSSSFTVPSTTPVSTTPPVIAPANSTATVPPSSSVAFDPFVKRKGQGGGKQKVNNSWVNKGTASPASAPVDDPGAASSTIPALNDKWGIAPSAPAPQAPRLPIRPVVIAAPLFSIDSVKVLVAPVTPPLAPMVTGAAAFVDSALVTWQAPADTTASGYDVFVGFAPGMEFPIPLNGSAPVVGNSYLVTGLTAGQTYYFTVRGRTGLLASSASNEVSAIPFDSYTPIGHLIGPVISMASTADGSGYWLTTSTGAVSAHGWATDLGSTASEQLAAPIVKIVADPKGVGYWEVAADGGVFAYGSATFEGAASTEKLNSPIVDMVPTSDGKGYWQVAADGGVFAYGDAVFAGSLAGTTSAKPTIGIAADPTTGGYWLVSADGTVTGFNAPDLGPKADELPIAPVVAIAATKDGMGFWEVTRGGSVYAFGDAVFQGPIAPLAPAAPVSSLTADPATGGYWLLSVDGGVYAYGAPFYGAG